MTDLELTPWEFDGLLERLGPSHQERARLLMPAGRFEIRLSPICFWVDQHDYDHHELLGLLHHFSSNWKDVLTEPTLVKLRALLAAAPAKKTTVPAPEGV